MEKRTITAAVMLLTFSVGIAAASILYFGPPHEVPTLPVEESFEPQPNSAGTTLEMVFVLDTTGSMGGLLDGAKQKVWGIVNDVLQKSSHPNVRVGLVAYRDNGDSYVTRITPVTQDLDKVYSDLMDLEAGGGGDHPENVRRALAEAVTKAGWSKAGKGLAQIIFLVGDAPPHDYSNETDVLASAAEAVSKNMIVNTIQCGSNGDTQRVWQAIANRGQGKYFAIAQDGGVDVIETPYDERLAELGGTIGKTYLPYGAPEAQRVNAGSLAAAESKVANTASNSARAERSLNKSLNKDAYQGDLIQDIENGKTKLEAVNENELPPQLRAMSSTARKGEIERRLADRKKVRQEILELSKKRDAFVRERRAKDGKTSGFDSAVSTALGEQLVKKGIK